MNCFFVTNYLSALLENTLSLETKSEVNEHLKGCDACRVQVEELGHVISRLKQIPLQDAGFHVRARLQKTLRDEGGRKPVWQRVFMNPQGVLLIVFLFVLVFAVRELFSPTVPDAYHQLVDDAPADAPAKIVQHEPPITAEAPSPVSPKVVTSAPEIPAIPAKNPFLTQSTPATAAAQPLVVSKAPMVKPVAPVPGGTTALKLGLLTDDTKDTTKNILRECRKLFCTSIAPNQGLLADVSLTSSRFIFEIPPANYPVLVSKLRQWGALEAPLESPDTGSDAEGRAIPLSVELNLSQPEQ